MISRYQGNIGCCGRFDCRKEGGKNIHRTKGNVMKSVRLGHALQGEGYHLRFPLRGASTPRNSAQLPLCFRTSDNRHSSSSRSVPLFPEVWTPPGSRRRKEREERREGSNEWMAATKGTDELFAPWKTRSANSHGQKSLPSFPSSFTSRKRNSFRAIRLKRLL